ncbi:MAG: GerMN domain-containing protein [Candidatus Gastranaerophilales bacterium]
MSNKEKKNLLIIAIIMLSICLLLGNKLLNNNEKQIEILPIEEVIIPAEEDISEKTSDITLFFIGQNQNGDDVYKTVTRNYREDLGISKLQFTLQSLINGPTYYEKTQNVYSEIPTNTNIISVYEQPHKIVIDLDFTFEAGGGTDSTYKRLFQLIKTMKANTNIPVFLYIEGQQAEVIGGEGIMITQPLDENSLGG